MALDFVEITEGWINERKFTWVDGSTGAGNQQLLALPIKFEYAIAPVIDSTKLQYVDQDSIRKLHQLEECSRKPPLMHLAHHVVTVRTRKH